MTKSGHNTYREFQFSWLMAGTFLPMQLLITYLYVYQAGNNPMSINTYWLLTALFAVVVLLFYGMTTTINDEFVTISFGVGLIRKRIFIRRIKSVMNVTSPWYYGYGIRLIPNGWLYNVSGSRGVEIRFNDKRGVVRIGTRNPSALRKEIEKRMTQLVGT